MTHIKSYAQNFEDVMLWRALGYLDSGCYIDVGAQSPLVDSVSMAFYEHGWRGFHVEPAATYAQELRLARPDETVVQAALGEERGTLTFHEMPGTGLSTLDPDIAASHEAAGFQVHKTIVPVITLDDLLKQVEGDVHWMKIDVEGVEEQVLRGWKESPKRPWIVIVESTLPLSQVASFDGWEPILLEKGYRFVYFDGLNRFYVASGHEELDDKFSVGPNCFDGFALSGTATSTFSGELLAQINQERQNAHAAEMARRAMESELVDARAAAAEAVRQAEDAMTGASANLQARLDSALQQSAELKARADWLEGRAITAENHAGQLERHTQWLEQYSVKFERHILWLEQHSVRFEHHMQWLESTNAHLVGDNTALRSQLEALHASTSWRVTAPLRLVRRLLGPASERKAAKVRLKTWLRPRVLQVVDEVGKRPRLRRLAHLAAKPFPAISRRVERMRQGEARETPSVEMYVPAVPSFRSRVAAARLLHGRPTH